MSEQRVQETCNKLDVKLLELEKKSKRKTNMIQTVCKNFFDKFEEDVKGMKHSYIEMRDSYDMWARNVLKPQELKEATLFALEQRVVNEESTRVQESALMKDVIDKLIYSLQQHLWTTSSHLGTKSYTQYQRQQSVSVTASGNFNEENPLDSPLKKESSTPKNQHILFQQKPPSPKAKKRSLSPKETKEIL